MTEVFLMLKQIILASCTSIWNCVVHVYRGSQSFLRDLPFCAGYNNWSACQVLDIMCLITCKSHHIMHQSAMPWSFNWVFRNLQTTHRNKHEHTVFTMLVLHTMWGLMSVYLHSDRNRWRMHLMNQDLILITGKTRLLPTEASCWKENVADILHLWFKSVDVTQITSILIKQERLGKIEWFVIFCMYSSWHAEMNHSCGMGWTRLTVFCETKQIFKGA